jgi:3-ketosteroid 9alpha-monooxygenase subunit A
VNGGEHGLNPMRGDTGWILLAFQGELQSDVTPATVAGRPLMVIREGGRLRVTDATCPHRGANLGYGGELVAGGIRCPFHGRLVKLGIGGAGYEVREHPTLQLGDALFVLIDGRHDRGFGDFATALSGTHELTPGFRLPVAVEADHVVENVFDAEHFESVHKLSRTPQLKVRHGNCRELIVEASLQSPAPNVWQDVDGVHQGPIVSRLCAHVFSPFLVVTELGAVDAPSVVITGATPSKTGTIIRVAVLVPQQSTAHARPDVISGLVADSRTAFEQDVMIWEHLVPGAPQNFDKRDDTVVAFRRFCEEFRHWGSDYDCREHG